MNMVSSPWIVIPTYNEKENIDRLLTALLDLPVPTLQILVVDDNSPDGTAAVVKSRQQDEARVHLIVRQQKAGLGRAYLHGFTYALSQGAEALLQMDADFSHDPKDVPRLLEKLNTYDVVLGSRYVHGISVINWPLRRLLISIMGNLYAGVITGMPFKDATGGFRAWRSEALRAIDFDRVHADGYGFQIVMAYRAWKKNLRMIEVPIIFTERREGKSKMSKAIIREALLLVWKLRMWG